MKPLETLFQWVVLAVVLLFVPEENALVAFDAEPGHQYGELVILSNNEVVIVAKNSQEESVDWEIPNGHYAISLHGRHSNPVAVVGQSAAPPHSVSVIRITNTSLPFAKPRVVQSESGGFFHPGPLTLLTRYDIANLYFLSAILCGGLIVLGFWMAQLYDPRASGKPDR